PHELLHKPLDAYAAEPGAAEIEVLPSGTCDQEGMLRDGRADVALVHAPLIALGRTVAVFPDSARAWLWAEHAAVLLTDAPPVVTHIAWPAHSRSVALAGLVRTATRL
ncbi:hypothetical protein ACWF7W_56105, partial [Nonomuraea angiospora]